MGARATEYASSRKGRFLPGGTLVVRNADIGGAETRLSSSPGQLPTPGPLQIRTRRFPPSGSSVDTARVTSPRSEP